MRVPVINDVSSDKPKLVLAGLVGGLIAGMAVLIIMQLATKANCATVPAPCGTTPDYLMPTPTYSKVPPSASAHASLQCMKSTVKLQVEQEFMGCAATNWNGEEVD